MDNVSISQVSGMVAVGAIALSVLMIVIWRITGGGLASGGSLILMRVLFFSTVTTVISAGIWWSLR